MAAPYPHPEWTWPRQVSCGDEGTMILTDKQIEEFVSKIETPKLVRRKKPEEATVLKVAADRKLSVEGQRDRVVNEVKELAVAEKNAVEQLDPNDYRVKRERDRQTGLYYRKLYETVALSEYNAKLRDVDHGNYDPIALFERQMRSEIDG